MLNKPHYGQFGFLEVAFDFLVQKMLLDSPLKEFWRSRKKLSIKITKCGFLKKVFFFDRFRNLGRSFKTSHSTNEKLKVKSKSSSSVNRFKYNLLDLHQMEGFGVYMLNVLPCDKRISGTCVGSNLYV